MENFIEKIVEYIKGYGDRMIIGISGHGASGKTSLANSIMKSLEKDDLNYINTDPYIIGSHLRKYTNIQYEYRGENHQYKMTACHPAAHNPYPLERDIGMWKDGLDLYTIGTPYTESKLIAAKKKILIVEGMTVAFTDPDLYDLKIYLYTDGETELTRRSVRDVSERGTDINYLRKSHEERRIQYEIYMHPKLENFDIVIKNSNEGYVIERSCF